VFLKSLKAGDHKREFTFLTRAKQHKFPHVRANRKLIYK